MAESVYIHIPFCVSKCKYCSFVSYSGCNAQDKQAYLDALISEIKTLYKNEPLKTLYLGGGTPSLLELELIKRVLDCFLFKSDCEITMEINPETVDFEYLCGLKSLGINRISVGVQSFDDEILKDIGRIHTSQRAVDTVKNLYKVGYENVSCDFIYGLPNQKREGFISDLKKAVELGVQHISLYGLKIEEGCSFYKLPPKNLPDDDMQADMYLDAIETLEGLGFEHYEISNFCQSGFSSNHNMNYWSCGEYYGFGAAAHGYIDGVRYSNHCGLKDYINSSEKRNAFQKLTKKDALEETIFLGFRRGCGIAVEEINKKFSIDFEQKYKNVLKKYMETGHIKKIDNRYRLSKEGFLLSNIVLSEFL